MTAIVDGVAAEAMKVRSARSFAGGAGTMAGLVVAAVALHGVALDQARITGSDQQLSVLIGWGALLGPLFAGLFGAISYTTELRHHTVSSTLLATPRRTDVVAAKAIVAGLVGASIGVTATASAAVTGAVVLTVRGIDLRVGFAEHLQFGVGGVVAGGLWALLGLGVGVAVRDQLAAGAGLVAWALFVEGILVDTVPAVGRAAPGALARALAGVGPDTLATPAVAAVGLLVYAAAGLVGAMTIAARRDHV